MRHKMKLCINLPIQEQIAKKLSGLDIDVELVGYKAIDSGVVFVGKATDISNRKCFNNSGYSIALSPETKELLWADENIDDCLSSKDYEHFIPALIVARYFGDTDDSILPKLKKFLAEDYSMNGEWTAHADKSIWKDEKTVYMTVRNAINNLIYSNFSV